MRWAAAPSVWTASVLAALLLAGLVVHLLTRRQGFLAALRGYWVVVPVDGASSVDPYSEQYTVWHLGTSPVVSRQVTLTRIDLVGF